MTALEVKKIVKHMRNQMIYIDYIVDVKNYTKNMQAFIFDLDNTLYAQKDYVASGFRQISRLFLGRGQEVYDRMWNAYVEERDVTGERAVESAIETMLQAQEMYSEEMKEKCLRIYEQHSPKIQPYDGVAELLEELREDSMRLGLLVDGPAEAQREKLRSLGIIPLFDEIIITDDMAGHADVMKFRKPDRICFDIMQRRLDVPYDQMAYVGADLTEDYLALQELGIRCVSMR